jgi:hypothetical protein
VERLAHGTELQRILLPFLFEDAARPRAIDALSRHF